MPLPAIPQHCGQPMTIANPKMRCLGCGYEAPVPGGEFSDKPPMH